MSKVKTSFILNAALLVRDVTIGVFISVAATIALVVALPLIPFALTWSYVAKRIKSRSAIQQYYEQLEKDLEEMRKVVKSLTDGGRK